MDWIRLLLVTLVSLLCSEYVTCGGTMSIRFKRYVNPGGYGANGHHCDGKFGIRISACDYVFIVCLDHSQPSYDNMRVCPYGRIQTQRIYNMDHVTFSDDIGGTANPIHLKFNEWPGSVYFKVKVYDYDNLGKWDYVDNLQHLIGLTPAASSMGSTEQEVVINGRTRLTLGVRVYCDYGYFGETCTKFCVSMDSEGGHYQCNEVGDKNCHAGWTGENCAEATDECGPQPCLNGGHCVDLHRGYSCQCPAGYKGDHCEINIDECESSPCQNGGVCDDGPNNYTCICDMGYEGRHCERLTDPCEMGQCENNGTCQALNATDYVCVCPEEFFGDNCEFEHVITTLAPEPAVVTYAPDIVNVVQIESVFGTSVRVIVAKVLDQKECDSLEPWIVNRLAMVDGMNRTSIHVRVTRSECTGDDGESLTELVLYIQYSVEGLSKDEVDFIVGYISRFVERGFPYDLYQGRECEMGRVSARTENLHWVKIKMNWLTLVVGGACLLVISLIIISVVIFKRRRRNLHPAIESYACVTEPNEYEESIPRGKLIVDVRTGSSAFNNDLYCQTQPRTSRLPSLPSVSCSDEMTNRESGFDEDDYYNADAESIYQSVE